MSDKPAEIIALTGGTGFVGRVVVKKLLDKGYRIKALVRIGSEDKIIQHKNINWIEGELGNPISEMRLCAGADQIIHMAGLVTARKKSDYFRVNAEFTGNLTSAAAKAGVKRFIYLSSLAAREPKLSSYAASKRAGEGAFVRRIGKMKGVVVRAPAVFGAGDKATAPFFKAIKKGFLPVPGGKNWQNRKISLVYVDDLAEFLTSECILGKCDGKTTSIATKASIDWAEFAKIAGNALEKPVKPLVLPLFILYPLAGINTIGKRVFGFGHLTLEKLREFLHDDWSVDVKNETKTGLQNALKETIKIFSN